MTIIVHHLEHSRSQRVLWLLEELGAPYEVKRYARDPVTRLAPPELRAVHPLGKSPVIEEGGHTIAETGAIVEYLLERHNGGALIPQAGSEAHLRYRYWLHFAEGSAMPMLVMTLLFNRLAAGMPPESAAQVAALQHAYVDPQRRAHLDLMEADLARGPYLAGDALSAADVMMSFPAEAAASRGGLGERPLLAAWLAGLQARPAYRAALARGGPYAYAPPAG